MKIFLIVLMFLLPARRVPDGRVRSLEFRTHMMIDVPYLIATNWGCEETIQFYIKSIKAGKTYSIGEEGIIRITCQSGNDIHIWKIIVPVKK